MTDVNITLADLRVIGICKKSRAWFRDHGMDPRDLKPRNGGIPVSRLYATNDSLDQVRLLEVAAIARIAHERKAL